MKVELTEQDIRNTVVFLKRTQLTGEESLLHAVLVQTYVNFLTPPEPEASASDNGKAPKKGEKVK